MIYAITFIISLFFIKIANDFKKNNRLLYYMFSFFGILLPCLLAAFRDVSIGTDVNVYIKPFFDVVHKTTNFFEYFSVITNSQNILFLLVTYICGKLTSSISLLFFMIHLLVIVPIYIALQKNAKKPNDVVLGMFIFFMFLNNTAYNMARQSIALSFCVLALTFLQEKNYKKFILLTIIAVLFHTSASFMICIFLIYMVLNSDNINPKNKQVFKIVISVITIICVIFIPRLLPLMKLFGFSAEKVALYSTKYLRPSFDFSYPNTFFYLFILFLVIRNKNKLNKNVKQYDFYSFLALLSVLVLQFGAIITYADRISYYLFYPIVFLVIPQLSVGGNKMTKNGLLLNILIISAFIVYWVFWIVILKYHATYPYVFIGG